MQAEVSIFAQKELDLFVVDLWFLTHSLYSVICVQMSGKIILTFSGELFFHQFIIGCLSALSLQTTAVIHNT